MYSALYISSFFRLFVFPDKWITRRQFFRKFRSRRTNVMQNKASKRRVLFPFLLHDVYLSNIFMVWEPVHFAADLASAVFVRSTCCSAREGIWSKGARYPYAGATQLQVVTAYKSHVSFQSKRCSFTLRSPLSLDQRTRTTRRPAENQHGYRKRNT